MGGWRRYLELQAKAKTGLSSGLVVWAVLAVVFGAVTFGFILVTAFIWLADSYGPLLAALALGGFFLLVTIIALVCGVWSHRRNQLWKGFVQVDLAPAEDPVAAAMLASFTISGGYP